MAESQGIFDYQPETLGELTAGLSPARFGKYVKTANGDVTWAMQLYLWNARLSKAFLFPLQICEVFTRNALDSAFSAKWGRGWVFDPPFELNDFSKDSHARTIGRLQRAAEQRNLPAPGPDDVVAALTFDFWSNLFRSEYEPILWNDADLLASAFPHLPDGGGRGYIQSRVVDVNRLRNRIAHHEPIFNRQDHGQALNKILDLIGTSSRVARDWTRQHCTVMAVAKSPPNEHSQLPGRPLAQANLRPPRIFEPGDALITVLGYLKTARPAVVLAAAQDAPSGFVGVSAQGVAAYIADHLAEAAQATGGLIDLSEHTLSNVIDHGAATLATVDRRATTGDAMAIFYPAAGAARPDFLIVVADGKPIGLLTRPDARF